jgi:putative membrane protein
LKIFRPHEFWQHVVAWQGSGEHLVTRLVLVFTIYSALVYIGDLLTPDLGSFGIEVAPFEVAGGTLGFLILFRTNAGHDRWWEARKLWGGIVNQSRNLVVVGLANGPADPVWKRELAAWVAVFAHVSRRRLRDEREIPEVARLVGVDRAEILAKAEHMPSAAALRISRLLREARDAGELEPLAYSQAEAQRALLIDHIGGCERILKTPMPSSYVTLIRRFIALMLLSLPFVLITRVEWLTPLFTGLIAYPILALDKIGEDLQRPFSKRSLNHLPLDDITSGIEANLLALLDAPRLDLDEPSLLARSGTP